MSRVVLLRVFFNLFLILFPTIAKTTAQVSNDCLEWDLAETENYLDSINLQNVPTIDMMIGGFECPVDTLPFGALKSDWARLTLLQKAQPKESALRKKLSRLFRILVVAYFQMEEKLRDKKPNSSTTSSTDILFTEESTTNIAADSKEANKIFKENSTTNVPRTEFFTTTEGVGKMSTTRKKGNSLGNRGDLPINTVTTANEIDSGENETTESSEISVSTDVSTELEGTLNNSVNPDGTTSATSETDITKPPSEMRNEDPFRQTESYPTVSDFAEDKGTATNFTENQTGKGVTGNIPRQSETTVTSGNYGTLTVAESTAKFIEDEINSRVGDIINERNKISGVDKGSEFTTISGLERKTSVNYIFDKSSKASDGNKLNPISTLERMEQATTVGNKSEFTVSDNEFDNKITTLEGTIQSSKASDANKFNEISKLESTTAFTRIEHTTTVDNKSEFTTVSDNKITTLEDMIEISKASDANKFNEISELERIEQTTTADNKNEFTTVSDNDNEMTTLEDTTEVSKASDANKFNEISELERIEQTTTADNKNEFTTVSDNDNEMTTLEDTTEISKASDANKFYPIFKLESPTSFTRMEQTTIKKSAIDNSLRNDPTEAAIAASTALTNSTDSSSESTALIAASSPIVDIDVTTPGSVVKSFQTISRANTVPLFSTSTYFANDVTSSTPANSARNENGENQSKRMDAGNYAPVSSASSEDGEENAVGGGAKSKFTTVAHYNSPASNFGERTSSLPVSRTTVETGFHSKESAENKIPGSGEDLNKTRRNGTVSKCHAFCNKIRKPVIFKKPTTRNDFWRYIVRNVTLSTITTRRSTDVTGESGGLIKSRKRGSSNTNVEKNFRWFYNIGQDESGGNGAGSHGINIECNEGKHGGGT